MRACIVFLVALLASATACVDEPPATAASRKTDVRPEKSPSTQTQDMPAPHAIETRPRGPGHHAHMK
jgi:hypothetical protein